VPFVLDNSVAMVWCFEDEEDDYAYKTLETLAEDPVVVPAVWPLEVANAILASERRGRLSAADTVRFLELLSGLPISVESVTMGHALDVVLDTARTYGLTSYDAAYLELAMRHGLPLATLDRRLADAAGRAGVPLVE
jgi:predicted nucleic acid-binding protein